MGQLQKLFFVNNPDDMRLHFALHHLEEDLGGRRPVVTDFFPFPLLAGPFDAGSSLDVNRDAVANVHLAVTGACMWGRAWNPALSREDNVAMEYTEHAEDIFE